MPASLEIPDDLISIAEASRRLKISTTTTHDWVRSGRLEGFWHPIAQKWKMRSSYVDKLLKNADRKPSK